MYQKQWKWTESEAEYQRALELKPTTRQPTVDMHIGWPATAAHKKLWPGLNAAVSSIR